MNNQGCNEMRFDLLINDLMPTECSNYTNYSADFYWKKGSQKKTLREFEKEIYYSNGDYEKAYSNYCHRRNNTGLHEFEKHIDREHQGPGHWSHYIHDQQGFRYSSHLSAPSEEAVTKKLKRLGHVRSHKLVGWDLVAPRDNSMYHIGEGGSSLKA